MDELVKAALARWPDVPDCTDWLALDARGRWRVGDPKDGPRQPITHATMNAFINRNYTSTGRFWLFQKGPQRVFVELEYTPFVWRLHPADGGGWSLVAQTGVALAPSAVWLDDEGRFVVEARETGRAPIVGVVHDHDTALVAERLRDAEGRAIDDDRIASLVGITRPESEPAAYLDLAPPDRPGPRLPLQWIASDRVAAHFGFEPHPAAALRIDVDTRR